MLVCMMVGGDISCVVANRGHGADHRSEGKRKSQKIRREEDGVFNHSCVLSNRK